jgi:hypothetical protein
MAVIDGISSAATSTAASTYQVKQAPQVNSVEAVDSANAQSAGADIASQVVTVKEKIPVTTVIVRERNNRRIQRQQTSRLRKQWMTSIRR